MAHYIVTGNRGCFETSNNTHTIIAVTHNALEAEEALMRYGVKTLRTLFANIATGVDAEGNYIQIWIDEQDKHTAIITEVL